MERHAFQGDHRGEHRSHPNVMFIDFAPLIIISLCLRLIPRGIHDDHDDILRTGLDIAWWINLVTDTKWIFLPKGLNNYHETGNFIKSRQTLNWVKAKPVLLGWRYAQSLYLPTNRTFYLCISVKNHLEMDEIVSAYTLQRRQNLSFYI